MENASKALIMAGAILIAILLISLAVYMFNQGKESVVKMSNLDEAEISAFNKKITPYLGKGISGSQVNALIQLIINANISAISNNDPARRVSITYPAEGLAAGSTATISLPAGATSMTVTPNTSVSRKVNTQAYYNVTATYTDGLITAVIVN